MNTEGTQRNRLVSRVAVIGCGYWGKNIVRNFDEHHALEAICDNDEGNLATMKAQYPNCRVLSYGEVLEDHTISAVAIATPAETHGAFVRSSLQAGKDVFVEKPLCLSFEEGQELIALAREKSRILMVGHLLWYHPAVLKLRELIHAGELGRIQYIYSNRLNLGKIRREENILWSFAPHDVSVILGLLDEMPEAVQAQGGNYLHQQIADVTVSLLSFPSGVKAHIFVSWLHPFKEQKLIVVGDRKMAVFDDTASWDEKLMLYAHQVEWRNNAPQVLKGEGEPTMVAKEEPLWAECAHFLECIASRKTPRTDGREGLRVLQVLNACQDSLESGQPRSIRTPASDECCFVHPTSVVDKEVEIGTGTKIWHFSHILHGTVIGEHCNIGQNVVIGPRGRVGRGCKIQNNTSLYEGVTLEDYVFCGPSVVFTNVYNPRAEIRKMDQLRPTLVRRGATLGANCTIVCGLTIGEYAFVGAGAVVTKDVPPHALVVGNTARQIGWMSRYGERLDLPIGGEGQATCPATGMVYRLMNDQLHVEETINES